MKTNPGIGLLGLIISIALILLGFGIFLPFRHAKYLAANEILARQILYAMGEELPRVEKLAHPSYSVNGSMTWQNYLDDPGSKVGALIRAQGILERENLLRVQGYLFQIEPFPEGNGIIAWPEEYASTGNGMFLFRPPKDFFESRNEKRRYSGLESPPREKAFPEVQKLDQIFSWDGQEWIIINSSPTTNH